jgi:hypothetical protein
MKVYSLPPSPSTPTLNQWARLRELRRFLMQLWMRQQASPRKRALTRELIDQIDRLRFADRREGSR